jgi:hypothetical protein
MTTSISDVVKFQSERLFNGAVDVDWFLGDEARRNRVSECFVFHGPEYHGVAPEDLGAAGTYQLIDTATFTRSILLRSYGIEDEPFTLAIAGYGTGKSHLAVTLGTLLSEPQSETTDKIIRNLEEADGSIGKEIRALVAEQETPCLVAAINGMGNHDLTAELSRQILSQLKAKSLETIAIEELRPRFQNAVTLIRMSNADVVSELCDDFGVPDAASIISSLEAQEERTYSRVQLFFADKGMKFQAIGGESIKDLIETISREYCGSGKPFSRFIILFDEFGRYTEFSTIKSAIAGSGVLQDLFEAVQKHSDVACFIGFIQFELNAYLQRISPEYQNDIKRYITRYQSAAKAYLSVNLETLFASLIEKKKPELLKDLFDSAIETERSKAIMKKIQSWFPATVGYRLWRVDTEFHTVIRKGCWPLSPLSTWLMVYLTATGKYLQERSALALFSEAFVRFQNFELPDDKVWEIAPVDLWSQSFLEEMLASEDQGQQGAIASAFSAVMARHGARISSRLEKILIAIVLASKMGLVSEDRPHANEAVATLGGLDIYEVERGLDKLQSEYNVVEWDESFKAYDIIGDALPRKQFLTYIRQQVKNAYTDNAKASLFAGKAMEWSRHISDLECDFSEEYQIATKEWRYQGIATNTELVETHLLMSAERWFNATAVNEPRGTVFYCYLSQNENPEESIDRISRIFRKISKKTGGEGCPILVVLLYDEEGTLGQSFAELAVIESDLTEQDKAKFGNLIGAHKERLLQGIDGQVATMLKQRRYLACLKSEIQAKRLSRVGTKIFSSIYPEPLTFPFDGFKTAQGNASDTCLQLTSECLAGQLDFNSVIAKPVKVKNRALQVLEKSWGVFTKAGSVSKRPKHPVLRKLYAIWDGHLQNETGVLDIPRMIRDMIMPPYGANIASAGLALGVFVAARAEQLLVNKGNEQLAVSQWVSNGLFKGKFLNLKTLEGTSFVSVAEVSTEWETLLDEWDVTTAYIDRIQYYERAAELKKRIPIPPALKFRYDFLEGIAQNAYDALSKMENKQDEGLKKLGNGCQYGNVGLVAWGASMLADLVEKMESETDYWTEQQIEELRPELEEARQFIVENFPYWLLQQTPKSSAPVEVGNFKHKMINLTGKNLKNLGFEHEYKELELHTEDQIENAETAANANTLIQQAGNWLDSHNDAFKIIRVATIRGLVAVGKDFSQKCVAMSEQIQIPQLTELRIKLSLRRGDQGACIEPLEHCNRIFRRC